MKTCFAFIGIFWMFCSCSTLDVYEKSAVFPSHEWKADQALPFTFEVKDTAAFYNFYIIIRHDEAYHYKNIWMNIQYRDPDSVYTIKREFALADNVKWLGTGMDDIIEHRIAFNSLPLKLKKKGNYTLTLQQIMREDPLQHVLNAGVRIEKVKP